MSADQQRLKSAIQIIAEQSPRLRAKLDANENKGGKPGVAGVGVSEAEEARICCDGSTSDNANPGTEERDPDSGGQTGLDPNDPSNLDNGPGTLDGVTDCATGAPICFDGGGFIPPDGWDSPSAAPISQYYTEGKYLNYNGYIGLTPCEAIRPYWEDTTEIVLGCENIDFNTALIEKTNQFGTNTSSSYNASQVDCELNYNSICDEDPPRETVWPEDGCTNLAIVNGSIVGSKYDPENDGSYSAPRDSIPLCDSEGNQIELSPSANGGWKTINSTTDNGYLYNSKGEQIAHIDGNEYSDPSV